MEELDLCIYSTLTRIRIRIIIKMNNLFRSIQYEKACSGIGIPQNMSKYQTTFILTENSSANARVPPLV